MAGNYFCYLEEREWYPSNIYNLKNYLNKNLRSRVSQNINYLLPKKIPSKKPIYLLSAEKLDALREYLETN